MEPWQTVHLKTRCVTRHVTTMTVATQWPPIVAGLVILWWIVKLVRPLSPLTSGKI